MALKKLQPEIVKIFNERLTDEYDLHFFYRNATNCCEGLGYLKAAAYFAEDAADEVVHAMKIQKYLTDWNIYPELKPPGAPDPCKGLVDILEKAYKKQLNIHEQYEKMAKTVLSKFDLTTFQFLQWFLNNEQKAVATYATFLNKLDLIDKENKNWVTEFEENNF